MKLRPIKATLIKGARGFVSVDGVPGLRLYPKKGEPFEIAFPASAIPSIQATLQQLSAALAGGKHGTLH